MWLIGTYKDINNNTITVKIRNEKNGDNIELGGALVKFAAEDAVTIDCDRDDYFTHIIKKSATIRLVTRVYLGDYLWAANQKSVIVNILRNGKCVFAGYVTPNTYTQDYVGEWTPLEVNCRDLLSTLEDTNLVDKDKYDDFKQNAQTISLKDYLVLFGIMNANLNLDNYPQPIFKSNFIWITDGYIYQDSVFYAKLIEVEQVTIDGQVKNIATGNYKLGKVLEPNWILDETKTTTYNGLKYNLEFAYLDIDGNGTYETRTNVSRRTSEPIFDQVYRDTVTYGDVIEQIHLEEYTVITNVTRTYVVDYGIHKAGDVEHLRGMEHCPFELRDEPNVSALKRYVWVYYGNEWHKTNFYEDIAIPDKPIDPNPDIPDPKPEPEYLCFTSTGDSTVGMTQYGTPTDISKGKILQYKLNNGQWQNWDMSNVTLADGDKMYIKSDDTIQMSESQAICKVFVMTGSIAASGNVMSLLNFAETMSAYGFMFLFYNCTALTTAPSLPVTTLGENCYRSMFSNCSSLTHAPALPATTLVNSCYYLMFYKCTSLTTAPELPATTLAGSCYAGMFAYCSSLTTAPELQATTLAPDCYKSMFEACTSLTHAPELPATTLATSCYYAMLHSCSSLTQAPELPATTLEGSCYQQMFQGCTSLTQAPELPATTLAGSCYAGMFYGCTSLTTAPVLPAITTTMYGDCYLQMFDGCTKLNYVKALFINNLNLNEYLSNWLRNVSPTGTFVKNAAATWTKTDAGIPSGWTVQSEPDKDYLCFISTGDSTVGMTQYGTPTNVSKHKVIQYKINNGQWQTWDLSAITLHDDDKMYVKSDDTIPMSESQAICKVFVMTGSIAAYGNILSLVNFNTILEDYAFIFLFYNCTSLTDVAYVKLPSTILTEYCYAGMFQGCTTLANGPKELPATTLAKYCYNNMFSRCTSLQTRPEILPATTLVDGCYYTMFYHCEKLGAAPTLPATELVSNCYVGMFEGCSSLNFIEALFTTDPTTGTYLTDWLKNVKLTGEFIRNDNATWNRDDVGIPHGWTLKKQHDPIV